MDILLTNDDGVHAEGLLALRAALAPLGEVVVAAPTRERSAVSHALTLHRPLPEPRRIALRGAGPVYAVDGTPVDCVKFALDRLCRRRPDLVVSGINHGPNLGIDIFYSGTVGGAAEGAFAGIPAVAVSLAVPRDRPQGADFVSAARLAVRLVRQARARKLLLPGRLLNVNLPNRPRPRGVRWTEMDRGPWTEEYVRRADPRGRAYYWIQGLPAPAAPQARDGRPPTDHAAVAAGFVSVTPLRFDLTDHGLLRGRRRGGRW